MAKGNIKTVDKRLYPESIRLTAGAESNLALEASEGESKLKKFSMTAYTGGAMRVGFGWPVVVDLAGMSVASQTVPILKDHDLRNIVGHSTQIEVSAQRIKLSGLLSGVGEAAQEVAALAANQFPWQSSIGASIDRMEFIDRGEKVNVNGKAFEGPIYVARKTVLGEVSFVAMGADTATSARVAASSKGVREMSFSEWLAAKAFDVATLSEVQKTTLQAAYDAEVKASATKPVEPVAATVTKPTDSDADIKARREAVAAEELRIDAVRKACGKHGDICAKAIGQGWSAEQTKTEVELADLRASRPQGPGIHAHEGGQIDGPAIEASLLLKAGVNHDAVHKQYDDKVMEAATSERYRGYSIGALMHDVIRASGGYARPGKIDNDFIKQAIKASRTLQAAGFSTVSLTNILGNTAKKAMLTSYQAIEVTWPFFCAVRSHDDFKTTTRVRLDSTGAFKKVGPDGELKHVGLTDAAYTNKLETYGAIIALTRQMIINDDLGAFLEIPQLLGTMAATRQEEAVFVLLLSNAGNFFHTDNSNIITGAGGVMSMAGFSAAELKFRNQVNSNGKPILTSPQVVLTGTTLKVTADNLYSEQAFAVTTTADTPAFTNNPHKGKYRPLASPYINNTAIKDQDGVALSNQSSTLWYMFADPKVRAAIAIAFLNGVQAPTIESEETDFDTLGMQWRGYSDFGVGFEDPTAAVKINGV